MIEKSFQEITADQFADRIVLRKADALVKISSDWNGASQILCHTLQSLAPLYSGKVDFYSLNYNSESPMSDTYRVESIPTILFFKKGTLVDRLSGLTHRTIISNMINQLINS